MLPISSSIYLGRFANSASFPLYQIALNSEKLSIVVD